MKYLNTFISIILVLLINTCLFPVDVKIIKNPRPNMFEDKTVKVRLKKVRVISEDLGGDNFLFGPCSITIDNKGNLYVYDKLQAKILKFDEKQNLIKSFGRKGQGPGEFSGTGRDRYVYINVGRDGKLYASDYKVMKVIVFDLEGNYIRDYRVNWTTLDNPVVDASGIGYFPLVKEKTIEFYVEKKVLIFSLPYEEEDFGYLFVKPHPDFLKGAVRWKEADLILNTTPDSKLLIYIKNTSRLFVVKEKKLLKKINIWPDKALAEYKARLYQNKKENSRGFYFLFSGFFPDEDDENVIYLQSSINVGRKFNNLYKINLQGKLLKILQVEIEESVNYKDFYFQKRGLFFALSEENIYIYQEVKK